MHANQFAVKKMNKGKRSRKILFIATAMTIIALASVLSAYAAVMLGQFQGGEVTIGGIGSSQGTVTYSSTNNASATWSTTLSESSTASSWYARLELSSTYTGAVSITWQLQSNPGSGWSNVGSPITTSVTLTGLSQNVYASSDGTITSNMDWSSLATTQGSYRVTVTIEST